MNDTRQKTLSFDNTEYAFEYKSTAELKKANFLFSSMGNKFLVNLGLKLMPLTVKINFPFSKTVIRSTIFSQFVGGETLEQTAKVGAILEQYKVKVILDYGVEGGENGEKGFDEAAEEFVKVISYASSQHNIPFMSIKITGIVSFSLLEKIDAAMHNREGALMPRYHAVIAELPAASGEEWARAVERLTKICETAGLKNSGVLIDAEESWIQDPVDALAFLMMERFNKEKAVVYNTVQLYRHDRLSFLADSYAAALTKKFVLGVKLVRGAYMDKERARAKEFGYASPIQPDKNASDTDYDKAVLFCMERLDVIAVIIASHNEKSNLYAARLLDEKGLPHDHPHVHFSQLYGMSDNITFNLAKSGYSVSKYLPFGPIKDVVPYLTRRARENSSVAGQTGRELALIKKELARRQSKA